MWRALTRQHEAAPILHPPAGRQTRCSVNRAHEMKHGPVRWISWAVVMVHTAFPINRVRSTSTAHSRPTWTGNRTATTPSPRTCRLPPGERIWAPRGAPISLSPRLVLRQRSPASYLRSRPAELRGERLSRGCSPSLPTPARSGSGRLVPRPRAAAVILPCEESWSVPAFRTSNSNGHGARPSVVLVQLTTRRRAGHLLRPDVRTCHRSSTCMPGCAWSWASPRRAQR